MKKLMFAVLALVVLVVAAAVAVPLLIPVEKYKEQITAQVREATGRDLVIAGDLGLSLFPSIAVEAGDLRFANAPGGAAPQMARLDRLVLSVKLMPLLGGSLEVESFRLVNPEIHLEVDAAGRPNWRLATAGEAAAGGAPGGDLLRDIRLGDVRLEGGKLTYTDARDGQRQELTGINLSVALADVTSPLSADGELTWNGEKVDLKLETSNLQALLEGRPSDIVAAVSADPVTLGYRGKLTLGDKLTTAGDLDLKVPSVHRLVAWSGQPVALPGRDLGPLSIQGKLAYDGANPSFSELAAELTDEMIKLSYRGTLAAGEKLSASGDIALEVPSLRGLADWAGQPMEMPGEGLGPLSIKGKLAYAGTTARFSEAEIRLDAIAGSGEVAVSTGGARPAIKGRLDVETLDLNPYLPPEPPPAEAAWSEQPIDLGGLKAADAELALSAKALKYRKIEIGRSALTVNLRDGRLVTHLQQLELYQGQGQGRLLLDGSGATPALDTAFELSGVQAEPLLRAAADNDKLSGTLETKFALKANGRSQKEMVSGLAGGGDFRFTDGTLKGVDLGAIASKIEKVVNTVQGGGGNIMQSLTSGDIFGSFTALGAMFGGSGEVDQETKFTSLTGSYTVDKGVASNRDLKLIGPLVNQRPLLRVEGGGIVDLPPRELAYQLDIRAFSEADQQRGVGGVVRLSGSMDSPDACVVVGSLCVGKQTKPTDLIGLEGVGKGVGEMLQKGPGLEAPTGAIGGVLGGKLGGKLGGALGGATGTAQPSSAEPPPAEAAAPTPKPAPPGGKLLDTLKGGGFKLPGQ
jgi:AsmA protein